MKHKRKGSKIVSFDTEVITKQAAEVLVNENTIDKSGEAKEKSVKQTEVNVDTKKGKKKRKNKVVASEFEQNKGIEEPIPKKKSKRDKKKTVVQEITNVDSNMEVIEDENTSTTEKPAEESIRAKKRQKHAKLQEEKRLKSELAMQQKGLNYLSMWKHSRNEWKFEKLRQVWLQQNMYNSAKVPNEFWDVLVQYFSSSKGKARNTIINDAIKIVEQEDSETNETEKEDFMIKLSRARDIVQNLQE